MAARTAVVAGTATAVSGRVQQRQMAKAEQAQAQQAPPPAPAPAPAAAPAVDITTELQKLVDMKMSGLLTDEEFATAKAKLLAG
jgi:hypothetical protein